MRLQTERDHHFTGWYRPCHARSRCCTSISHCEYAASQPQQHLQEVHDAHIFAEMMWVLYKVLQLCYCWRLACSLAAGALLGWRTCPRSAPTGYNSPTARHPPRLNLLLLLHLTW